MSEPKLDWSSAEVNDSKLTVPVEGELPDGWEDTFTTTVQLLGGGSWGEIKLEEQKAEVSNLSPGSEEKLRHFLESVVQQANASCLGDEEEQDEEEQDEEEQDEDDGEDSGQESDKEMSERFRSFAEDDESDEDESDDEAKDQDESDDDEDESDDDERKGKSKSQSKSDDDKPKAKAGSKRKDDSDDDSSE